MFRWLVAIVGTLVFGGSTLLTLLIAVPAQILAWPFDPDRRVANGVGRWTWAIGHFFAQPFWRLNITGQPRAGQGPWVVVANHQSMLDIPLLMHLPFPMRVTARPGVFRMPVLGQMARLAGAVSVDADEEFDRTVAHCRGLLDRGISVVVFPEGTRSDGRTFLPFQRGAFELALRAGRPLLPVVIRGTADALPKERWWSRKDWVNIHLCVLPEVRVEGRQRRGLALEVQRQMKEAFDGPHPLEVSDALFERYRRAGRFHAGFAKYKTLMDPVFWALWGRLPRTGTLVDVGAGEGLLAMWLRTAGSDLEVLGLDPDVQRIQRAMLVGDARMRFQVGDARTFEIPPANAITCIDVLHYLTEDEQKQVLQRLSNALLPGGILLIRDPSADPRGRWTRWSERLFVALGRHQGEGVHVSGAERLAGWLKEHLDDVRIEDCSTGPFANLLVSGRRPVTTIDS